MPRLVGLPFDFELNLPAVATADDECVFHGGYLMSCPPGRTVIILSSAEAHRFEHWAFVEAIRRGGSGECVWESSPSSVQRGVGPRQAWSYE